MQSRQDGCCAQLLDELLERFVVHEAGCILRDVQLPLLDVLSELHGGRCGGGAKSACVLSAQAEVVLGSGGVRDQGRHFACSDAVHGAGTRRRSSRQLARVRGSGMVAAPEELRKCQAQARPLCKSSHMQNDTLGGAGRRDCNSSTSRDISVCQPNPSSGSFSGSVKSQ